jgi:hypothetical protein
MHHQDKEVSRKILGEHFAYFASAMTTKGKPLFTQNPVPVCFES